MARAALTRCGLATAALCVIASASAAQAPPWRLFTAILWHSDLPGPALATLPRLGITAGRIFGLRGNVATAVLRQRAAALSRAGLEVMVENIATDFYAAYHRWQPGVAVNQAFAAVQQRYRVNPADPMVWQRRPSLNDAVVFQRIRQRLAAHAAALRGHPALYLCLGDETGIADLSAAWDFDETPDALGDWRRWLRRRYGRLQDLNRLWRTHYQRWSAVRPTRTDQALDGSGSLAAWMVFKAWMDVDFAASIQRGSAAIHRADPRARAGIEGVQLPGWGGYDYAWLAPAADVMELPTGYPMALARAFNPNLVMLTTSAGADLTEALRLWRFLLLGGRGVILWDPQGDVVRRDGVPGPRGLAYARILRDLRGELGTRLLASHPVHDPIAVVYSQSSFRLRWLLDRRAERKLGQDWTQRSNDRDLADSAWRDSISRVADRLTHLGINPTWLDETALTPARLATQRAVILPQTLALDAHAIIALRGFAAAGGLLLADAEPGLYDMLGRPRSVAPLAGLGYRLRDWELEGLRRLLPTYARVLTPSGTPRDDISIFRYDTGHLVVIQRDRPGPAEPGELVLSTGTHYNVVVEPALPTVLRIGMRRTSNGLAGRTKSGAATSPRADHGVFKQVDRR